MGADAHIKYKSDKKFGAVLIAQKPVTLTSYDDETLFRSWLATNRSQLSSLYGAELRRYGLWIVTRTYTCQHCSINAWDSSGKEANMTMKAKANMLGDLGGDLEWTERLTDKDWSHYYAKKKGDTVVVFFDGVEVPASSWWWEGLRGRFGRQSIAQKTSKDHAFRSHSRERRSRCGSPKDMTGDQPEREKGLLNEDLWGSSAPLRRGASVDSRSTSRGRQSLCNRNKNLGRSMSTPRRLSRYLDYDQPSPKSQAGNVVLGTQTDHVDDPSPHKTRFLVPEQPHRAQSTASTVASSSSIKVRKPAAHDGGGGAPPSRPSSALQRKAATPVLRDTS